MVNFIPCRSAADVSDETQEFGIVANVCEIDRVLRMGAKVTVLGGDNGMGYERILVRGASRSGRPIDKMAPIHRFTNFRAAWMHESLLSQTVFIGTKGEMTTRAQDFQQLADRMRAEHPNRAYRPEAHAKP